MGYSTGERRSGSCVTHQGHYNVLYNPMSDKGHNKESGLSEIKTDRADTRDFVLEKSIFSNIFEKDIQRVYIYKKAERLAKAIHLITPAFANTTSLRDKLDSIAVGLVDASISPPGHSRDAFSRELLALSSVLAIARATGTLSPMNATLISHEAHTLLSEVANYEEPRLFFEESPTLAALAKSVPKSDHRTPASPLERARLKTAGERETTTSNRAETILSVIKDKGRVYIKDISNIVRDVSEKTLQRELRRLVDSGVIIKEGNRRWTAYSLAG